MGTLGFDDYVSPLKIYLTKYRQASKANKTEQATVPKAQDSASLVHEGSSFPLRNYQSDSQQLLGRQFVEFSDSRVL